MEATEKIYKWIIWKNLAEYIRKVSMPKRARLLTERSKASALHYVSFCGVACCIVSSITPRRSWKSAFEQSYL